MTLDEAIIKHIQIADSYHKAMPNYDEAADHRQLAEWLTELKDLREENEVLTSECDRLIKEKGELLSKVSGGDVLRICQLEEHLEKAKQLLKAAVEDMHIEDMCDVCVERIPNSSIHCPDGSNCFVWRYKDEALKLIGGSENG